MSEIVLNKLLQYLWAVLQFFSSRICPRRESWMKRRQGDWRFLIVERWVSSSFLLSSPEKRIHLGISQDEIDSYTQEKSFAARGASMSVGMAVRRGIIHLAAILLVQLFMVKKCIDRPTPIMYRIRRRPAGDLCRPANCRLSFVRASKATLIKSDPRPWFNDV